MSDEELLESIDRHFKVYYVLSASNLRQHQATGTCPECQQRTQKAADVREAVTSGG